MWRFRPFGCRGGDDRVHFRLSLLLGSGRVYQMKQAMPAQAAHKTQKTRTRADPLLTEGAVESALAWLERRGTRRNREGMARYAIRAKKVFGVSVADLRRFAKRLGRNHALATALWDTGWHEARMLAAFVEEPERVTSSQMDRWCREFENWAICDTVCFHLFARTRHAWRKVDTWSGRREEFAKRAAFALLASLSVHDKAAVDASFLHGLQLIEAAAGDERNFVKKSVNWALRSIGKQNLDLNKAAVRTARRLAESEHAAARWVGKDALRELESPAVAQRLAARSSRKPA